MMVDKMCHICLQQIATLTYDKLDLCVDCENKVQENLKKYIPKKEVK